MDCIRVATSTDENYLPYAAVMAYSLASSRNPDTPVELTILHSGISSADRANLESAADGVTVRWMHMTPAWYRACGVSADPMVLSPHYYRCLLPRLYPDDVDRVIYIDADTMVLTDLGTLWKWPLDARPVAATLDLMSVIKDAIDHWNEIGLDGEAPYFNSGVMAIDLKQWRADMIGERVMRLCQADRHRLLIRGRWNQHDQYGFNVLLQHWWARLPARWNHFAEREPDGAAIVHFLGDTKPGAPRTRPELTDLFYKAVDATPWAGWRPTGRAVGTV